MHRIRTVLWITLVLAATAGYSVGEARRQAPAAAPVATSASNEPVDQAAIAKLRALGLDASTSRVMETAGWLTDVYGPRLTGSPNIERAGQWVVARMKEWGADRADLEAWPASTDPAQPNNGFPRNWVNEKFYMAALIPQAFPIVGTPVAWTPGTDGVVRGGVALVTGTTAEDHAKYAGRLRGKWVLSIAVPEGPAFFQPQATRLSTEQLDALTARGNAPPAARGGGPGRGDAGRGGAPAGPPFDRTAFFREQGVLGVLTTTARGHGIYTVGGANRTVDPSTLLPTIAITAEHYGRLARMVDKGQDVVVEAEIRNVSTPNPPMFNVVAELRGTDKPDEVVVLGAHFDSWHASTGATDNAAGSAAMIEAMRLLKASGLKLRRTVRMVLWTGEEQGLIGSALYVRQHFGGARGRGAAAPAPITPAHAKVSGYFNIDNGTGAIRGVYLQQNEDVAPIFRAWMAPLADMGMTHLTRSNTGGTDHTSFDAAGIPGWQFIQDGIEYNTMTHHTNLDSYERLQAEDMRKNATIAAIFAYLAANRDGMLPRKAGQ